MAEVGATVAPQEYRKAKEEDTGKTVGVFQKNMKIEPVVGWLICVEGPEKGRDSVSGETVLCECWRQFLISETGKPALPFKQGAQSMLSDVFREHPLAFVSNLFPPFRYSFNSEYLFPYIHM